MNRLDLVGSNGAGKSTLVGLTLAPLLPRSLDLVTSAHGSEHIVILHVILDK